MMEDAKEVTEECDAKEVTEECDAKEVTEECDAKEVTEECDAKEVTEECDNATASKCPELIISTSDESLKPRIPPSYLLGRKNDSPESDDHEFTDLTTDTVDSLNKSIFGKSSETSNLPERSEDAATPTGSKYLDLKSLNSDKPTRKIADETAEFKSLVAKCKIALDQRDSNASKPKVQIESVRKKEKPKSSIRTKRNITRKDVPVSTQTKVSNLEVLLSNEDTREMGLFYSLLANQEIPSRQSAESNSMNQSSGQTKSSKLDRKSSSLEVDTKSKSPESDKKSKCPELKKKSKSSELNRKPKSSKSEKKSKSYEMYRKSSSSEFSKKKKSSKLLKDTKSSDVLMSELLQSLQEMKLTETNSNEKAIASENETASIQSGNEMLLSHKPKQEIESYFGLFKKSKTASSPRESSDSGTLTPGSDDPESNRSPCNLRKNSTQQFAKSELQKFSAKSNLSDFSAKSELCAPVSQSNLTDQSTKTKQSEPSVRPKLPKPYARSKIAASPVKSELYDQSVRPKLSDGSVRSKLSDGSVRSKLSDGSVRSKLSDGSVRSKLSDGSVRSKIYDSAVTSKYSDSSVKSKSSDSSVRTKLPKPTSKSVFPNFLMISKLAVPRNKSDEGSVGLVQKAKRDLPHRMMDLKLEKYIISRRPYLLEMRKNAKRVKTFMNQVAALKQEYRNDMKVTNSHRRKRNALEWLKLLHYWDLVKEEMNMIIETIDILYDSNENVSISSEEFHDFMRQILIVFQDILELNCTCNNGLSKYTQLCSSHEMFLFLNHAITFESHASSLFQKIMCESQQFTFYKKNEGN